MKEHGRGCYRAARLWCKTGNMQQRSHGIADLVLRDGEDVVYESTYMQEIELAEALRTEAVGDGTGSHLSRPVTSFPLRKLSCASAASSGSIPMTRTSGR